MKVSRERLAAEAEATGFRADVLEKVAHLLSLLEALQSHPFLSGRLALKGGTALNLFLFDVPRLSVDVDLNYIGKVDRDEMRAERPVVERALKEVFSREGFGVRRLPEEHAGGKWMLRYESSLGGGGNLEVDINFMFRVPLWPATVIDSHSVGAWRAKGFPMVDRHELAAGKLAALLSRKQARDLFDAHRVLGLQDLDPNRLRIGFVVYGAMNRRDWRTVAAEDVSIETTDWINQVVPMLRTPTTGVRSDPVQYVLDLVKECQDAISAVLPFTDGERSFLDLLLDQGVIDASKLTEDAPLRQRIQAQPMLLWKALNVRKHKGLS